MTAFVALFDRATHRRRLERAATSKGAADFLRRRAGEDLARRLATVNRRFPLAVELGARHGAFLSLLSAVAPNKVDMLVECDLAEAMLRGRPGTRLVADEARLPFAAASLDLAVSNLTMHWVDDLVGALIQIRRALRPDGLAVLALLGGATLTELRQALTEAEVSLTRGAGPRVSPFLDAFDAAGLMQRAGFALPVVDVDRVEVRYADPAKLLADLRAMGETNVLVERPRRPLTRGVLRRALEMYADRFGTADGRVVATFEILTLTGWAPHPDQPRPLRPGSAKARLADALGVVERFVQEKTDS